MSTSDEYTRADAVEALERFGIRGVYIYLVDIIPLIEMIWADGKTQESELEILDAYLKKHVAKINEMAGYQALTMEKAKKFTNKFIEKRPSPQLLKTLRSLYAGVFKSIKDEKIRASFKSSLLAACMDIASSSVTEYPYNHEDRFNPEEKQCFFEIVDSLEK